MRYETQGSSSAVSRSNDVLRIVLSRGPPEDVPLPDCVTWGRKQSRLPKRRSSIVRIH